MELSKELREKYAIGEEAPIYLIHTSLDEKQLRRAIFTTRRRDRHIYYLQMLALALVLILLAWILQNSRILQGNIIFIILCIARAINARQRTDETIGSIRLKFGDVKTDYSFYFLECHVIVFNHISKKSRIYEYSHFHQLYIKDDFLFWCSEKYKGYYILYKDIQDRERFIRLLNDKCPDLKLRK